MSLSLVEIALAASIILNLLMVGLVTFTRQLRGFDGPMGPPGAMGMMGEPGRDLFQDSIEKGIIHKNANYEIWLRSLNTAILNQLTLERPAMFDGTDVKGPKG